MGTTFCPFKKFNKFFLAKKRKPPTNSGRVFLFSKIIKNQQPKTKKLKTKNRKPEKPKNKKLKTQKKTQNSKTFQKKLTFEIGPKGPKKDRESNKPVGTTFCPQALLKPKSKVNCLLLNSFMFFMVCACMRAWPWALALAHFGVGLVLGVWGVGAGRCGRAIPSFFMFSVFCVWLLVFCCCFFCENKKLNSAQSFERAEIINFVNF